MQLVRFADGVGWSLGMIGVGGTVLSLRTALEDLRHRGRLNGLSEPFIELISTDGRALLSAWPAVRGAVELAAETDDGSAAVAGSLSELIVGPLVPSPEKVIGVSYNYGALAAQEGIEKAGEPVVFMKAPSSVAGAFDEIRVPASIRHVDFEAEVGVVVGAVARHVDEERAAACIGGYTVVNDMTAKILPRPAIDLATITVRLKAIDCFAPVGAVVVTADEALDFGTAEVCCRVNGEQRQRFPASDWIHTPAEVVSFVSSFLTLQPGDLISMGTSRGIGVAEVPPRLLADGDIVETELCGYPGTRNTVRFAQAPG
jgi:2-keto-4-pentenoate hydratase/2-oxohepta-3-ene-1,7-dioic acid hydratase in catechol pathway